MKVYFDNAATTALSAEVIDEMTSVMKHIPGNPSSFHSWGREAKVVIENARKKIAGHINANPSEIYFTSGAVEAITTIIWGAINSLQVRTVISSKLEHSAVVHTLENLEKKGFITLKFCQTQPSGHLNLLHLHELIEQNKGALVALMHANNEIGHISPLKEIAALCHQHQCYLFTDMVQTMGKLRIDMKDLAPDFAVCSGHKLHGPKGIGFLYIRNGVKIQPLLIGGGQEMNQRSGTENLYGIAGLAKAFEIAYQNLDVDVAHILGLKDYMISQLQRLPEIKFNSDIEHKEKSLHNILNVSFPALSKYEMLIYNLDIANIAVSSGSACSSGVNHTSHVIQELDTAERLALRFSFCKYNTKEEVDYCMQIIRDLSK